MGVREVYSVDPFDEQATVEALKIAKTSTGVNVIVCHAPCVVNRRKSRVDRERPKYTINRERCNACSACIRLLGCPGILVEAGEFVIDQDLCDGCAICARVCQHDAVEPVGSGRD